MTFLGQGLQTLQQSTNSQDTGKCMPLKNKIKKKWL